MLAILLASVTLVSTGLGGLAAIRFRHQLHPLLGFSAGAVLAVVFFDILPEVFAAPSAPTHVMLAAAAGFLAFFALERYTALLGATSTLFLRLPESLLPWILAFFSGFFIYVGASDLLPEARENDSPLIGVATVVGMLLVFLVSRALPR